MSDPRARINSTSKQDQKREKRVVVHERVVTAEPALLSPEEEEFNRFLEEEAKEIEKKTQLAKR